MSTQTPEFFSFDGYTVRPITEQDRPYLTLLIEGDDYHRNKMDADFFLKLQPGEDAWALEDEAGKVVFYFKTATAVRMAIQFADTGSTASRRKNQSALLKGLRWIEALFRANRFREIIFETEGPELTVFAKRHLGFVEATGLLSLTLESQPAREAQPETLGTVPTDRLEMGG
jgi:hypothetical protein